SVVATVTVGGDAVMTNAAQFTLYSGITNAAAVTNFGALLTVGGTLTISTNSWLYPVSHPTNGGSPLIRTANLTLLGTNGGISAYGRGFQGGDGNTANGCGPGGAPTGSSTSGGGSHAGVGSVGSYGTSYGTTIYGNSNAPVHAGSGGARTAPSANGGGVIRLEVGKTALLNGMLNANGSIGVAGAGAGGSIYLRCNSLRGSTGILKANGGDCNTAGGAGGGGRIAVYRLTDTTAGLLTVSAEGGAAGFAHLAGGKGSIVWGVQEQKASGSVFFIR
ncbi:MAG: hypothetical protein WCL44_15800, partial [bacterium]